MSSDPIGSRTGERRRVRALVTIAIRDELMQGPVPAGTLGTVLPPPSNLADGYLFVAFDNGVCDGVHPLEVTDVV